MQCAAKLAPTDNFIDSISRLQLKFSLSIKYLFGIRWYINKCYTVECRHIHYTYYMLTVFHFALSESKFRRNPTGPKNIKYRFWIIFYFIIKIKAKTNNNTIFFYCSKVFKRIVQFIQSVRGGLILAILFPGSHFEDVFLSRQI